MPINVNSSCYFRDYECTSASPNNITTGTVSFTVELNKAWRVGDEIMCIARDAKLPTYLVGTVTSYNPATGALVVSITRYDSSVSTVDVYSGSTNTIGSGSKTFVVANKLTGIAATDLVQIARRGGGASARFLGSITSYDNTNGQLVLNATGTSGGATNVNDWVINSHGLFSGWDIVPSPVGDITISGSATLIIDQEPKHYVGSFIALDRGVASFINTGSRLMVIRQSSNKKVYQFENNGIKNVSGGFVTIYTGNGLPLQTISLSGDYSKLDYPFVMVESGANTNKYRYWYTAADKNQPYGGFDDTVSKFRYGLDDFGVEKHGNFCLWKPSGRSLLFGDGVSGNIIPSGSKVIMPNIHFTAAPLRSVILSGIATGVNPTFVIAVANGSGSSNLTTNGTYFINSEEFIGTLTGNLLSLTSRSGNATPRGNHVSGDFVYGSIAAQTTSINNRSLIDVAAGGILNLNNCSYGNVYMNVSNPQSFIANNLFLCGGASIGTTSADVVISGLYNTNWPQTDATTLSLTTILGQSSFRDIYCFSSAFNTNGNGISILNNSSCFLNELESISSLRQSSNHTVMSLTANQYTDYIKDICVIGGRFAISNSSNFEIETFEHSDQLSGKNSTANALNSTTFVNCQNVVIRKIRKSISGAATRNSLLGTDANCNNILFHDIVYEGSSNLSINSFAGKNIKVVNADFGIVRDAGGTAGDCGYTSSSSADTILYQNVKMRPPSSYGADNGLGISARSFHDYVTAHSVLWRSSAGAASNFPEYGPYHVLIGYESQSTGTLFCGGFGTEATRDIYDFSGSAFLGNNGYVFFPNSGDSINVKSYQAIRSITGFSSNEPIVECTNTGNLYLNFKMYKYGDAVPSSWYSLSSTGLNYAFSGLSGYNSNNGLSMHTSITTDLTSDTTKLTNIRIFTLNDTGYNPPIGYTTFSLSNLQSGSLAVAYVNSGIVDTELNLNSTGTLFLPYTFDGNYLTGSFKVRCYGCEPDDFNLNYNQNSITRTEAQTIDTKITNTSKSSVAAYITLETLDKFYDYCQYYLNTENGYNISKFANAVGSQINIGSYNLIIDASASSVFSLSGSTITIKASVLSDGTTFTSLTTTGTITYSNGAVCYTILTDSTGTTGIFTLSSLSSNNVYLEDNTATQKDYQTSISSFVFYIASGATGTWRWRSVKYGVTPETGTFTATGGGRFTASVSNTTDAHITQTTAATVAAYTTLENWDKFYDYCQYYLTTSSGKTLGQFATQNGAAVDIGSYNITVDSAAASVFALSSGITVKATNLIAGSTFQGLITTGTVSTLTAARIDTWYSSVAGRSVLILATSILSNSRYRIYNVTGSTQLNNTTATSEGVYFRITWTSDITLRLTTTYINSVTAKLPTSDTATLTNTGATFLTVQEDDDAYNDNAIDGSTVTEFAADYPNIQVDITDTDNTTTLGRLYAWYKYNETTSNGIINFIGGLMATDSANYSIDGTLIDVAFDNKKTDLLTISGGYITKTGGSSLVATTTTGSIYFDSGKAYVSTSSIATALTDYGALTKKQFIALK